MTLREMSSFFAAIVLFGCSKPSPEPTPSAVETIETAAPKTPPAAFPTTMPSATTAAVADVAWDVPAAWQSVPSPSSMRKATYKIPKAAGDTEDAEMSVTQVGGGVDANVQRWAGQFSDSKDAPKRTTRKVGGLTVTVVEIHGTFAGSGMPGAPAAGPKKNYELLGAIVESTDPPYFFKLTGPEKTVTAARANFDKLVGSMKAK